ncbi:MAG: DUF5666 domain-containing protein [Vicinamibacterales bacterium]
MNTATRVVIALLLAAPLASAPSVAAQSVASRDTSGAMLKGLSTGQQVKVEGRRLETGAMRVERLRARDGDGQVRIEGQLTQLESGGTLARLLDFPVSIAAGARVLDGDRILNGPSELHVGDRVEVRGILMPDGSINANRVRRSPLVGTPRDEIEGPISQIFSATRFEVIGRLMVLDPGAAYADERSGNTTTFAGTLRRDDDEQQVNGFRLGSRATVGGRIEAGFNASGDKPFVTDPARGSDLNSAIQGDIVVNLGPRAIAYAKVQALREYPVAGVVSATGDVRVKEANLLVALAGPVALQVGRLRVRDAREWFADDYLDAVRVMLTGGRTTAEVGVSYGFNAPAGQRSRTDERQLFLAAAHEFSDALTLGLRVLMRDDRNRHERPNWTFVEASGQVDDIRYWGNAAARRGSNAAGIALRGYAFDTGVLVRPGGGRLALTASYAMGSADRNPTDRIDGTFKQTGLEDTQTRIAGFKRIHSYGDLLEPDLSNLRVLTAGFGWQWTSASLDAAYHQYRLDAPSRSPGSAAFPLTPARGTGNLGREVDLLMTRRLRGGIDLSFVGGFYLPAAVSAARPTPLFFWRPEIQISF